MNLIDDVNMSRMLRSHRRARKKTRTTLSCKGAIPSSSQDQNLDAETGGKAEKLLAYQDSVADDCDVWRVTDDWPSSVPITAAEVDVIEAFLRREIDALLG